MKKTSIVTTLALAGLLAISGMAIARPAGDRGERKSRPVVERETDEMKVIRHKAHDLRVDRIKLAVKNEKSIRLVPTSSSSAWPIKRRSRMPTPSGPSLTAVECVITNVTGGGGSAMLDGEPVTELARNLAAADRQRIWSLNEPAVLPAGFL